MTLYCYKAYGVAEMVSIVATLGILDMIRHDIVAMFVMLNRHDIFVERHYIVAILAIYLILQT